MYTKLSGGASFDGFGGQAAGGGGAAAGTGGGGAAGSGEDDGTAGTTLPTPSTSTSGLPSASLQHVQLPQGDQKDGAKKPKRKHRKGAGAAAAAAAAAAQAAATAKEDEKPMTLTRWLTAKVDDLVAVTDE